MMTKLGSSRMALRSSMKAAPTRVSGYCQVDENRCDRPTRYCGRSPSWADMLGIRIGLMPQLDSALPLAGRGCNAAAYGSRGLRRAGE